MSSINGYDFVEKKFNEIGLLSQISNMLHWDTNVMMPKKSSEARGKQLAYLDQMIHDVKTNENLTKNLQLAIANSATFSACKKANLNLITTDVKLASALPLQLITDLSLATNRCEMKWRVAKEQKNFSKIIPDLHTLLQLVRESAKLKGDALNINPYDALVSEYDLERDTKQLDVIFKDLKTFLADLIKEVGKKQNKFDFKKRYFPIDLQDELSRKYLHKFGFDFDKGRLDISSHPFCGGIPDDSRITTRFDKNDVVSGLYAVIHEAGHSIYETNLPKLYNEQPVNKACGFAIHESQSLFFEKHIGLNPNFVENVHSDIVQLFNCEDFNLNEFSSQIYQIQPSFIRVDADEITYPLHVILRYEIEKELISGELDVKHLPERWNQGMHDLLGIIPTNDALGCLQDIHWYAGMFGYFPAYTIGAITSAQIMAKIRQEIDNVDSLIAANNFGPIINWLNKNIHNHGSKYKPQELIKVATKEYLDVKYFKQHLIDRYINY